jgi:hypothetical protein
LPVPTGPTKVEAVLAVIGVEGEVDPMDIETHAVSVSARTTIVGGDGGALLAPALAIDAALGDPQFAAWVQAADPAMWINPDVARIEGRWWIGLFRNGRDQATLLGQVQVDDDSRIVARRFDR